MLKESKTKKFLIFNVFYFATLLVVAFIVGLIFTEFFSSFSARAQDEEADVAPPILYSIKIDSINSTTTIITWETDELADSLINYGLNKDYGIVRDPRADKLEHKLVLDELSADTTYFFRITSTDASGNQGISSDFSFITPKDQEKKPELVGLQEEVNKEGTAGLNEVGVEEILAAIKSISSEEVLDKIQEQVQSKAEEIISPPTIILDIADIEIGTDYAVVTWETDKESSSIVALAHENEYDETADDPYTWKEGEPDELVLQHRVEVNGLTPATTYHFQVQSKSSYDLTGKSKDKTFKTKSIAPEIFNIQMAKIEEEAATIRYTTNIPCSSIIEYTNLNNNDTKLEGNSSFLTAHTLRLTNLTFDTYYSFVITVESEEGEKAKSEPVTFITTRDQQPPAIAKVNTESTLYPGTENKIQTIASWETDEPAQCQLFYHQGLVLVDEPDSLPKEDDYATKHVQVVTNFLPSTVYKFWIVCNDEADNIVKSDDFTMLTPTQEQSIIDIIIKNFESSFGWLKKIRRLDD